MGAIGWLVARQLRRHCAALLPIGLLTAAASAAALVSIGAAERTDTAYARYAARSEASDLIINPVMATEQADSLIRSLPGVERVTIDSLMLATIGEEPFVGTWAEAVASDDGGQIKGAVDGHYLTSDRPAVAEGRLPTGAGELFVNSGYAARHRWAVGDELTVSVVGPSSFRRITDWNAPLEPLSVDVVTLVGTGTFPDEAIADELYPSVAKVLVSSDIASRDFCLGDASALARTATQDEMFAVLTPEGCSNAYTYWALELADGAAGVEAAKEAFLAGADELNAELPAVAAENDAGYFLIPTENAVTQERAERSVVPIVTALYVLGAVAGAAGLAALALLTLRDLRRDEAERRAWHLVGLDARSAGWAAALPRLLMALGGVAVGTTAAWLVSPIGPVGSARSVEPRPGMRIAWPTLVVSAGIALAVTAIVGAAAWSAARGVRRVRPAVRRRGAVARIAVQRARVDVGTGARAAYSGAGAGVVVASCAVAVCLLVAATVFGVSMVRMLDTPRAYGWPWDIAILAGSGYGSIDDTLAAEAAVSAEPEVTGIMRAGLLDGITVDGHAVTGVLIQESPRDRIVMRDGVQPDRPDEVALGARSAAAIGVGVGDVVTVASPYGEEFDATVSGIAVLPSLGQYASSRAGLGVGVVIPVVAFGDGLDGWDDTTTFVGLHLNPGADRQAILDRLLPAFVADEGTTLPIGYTEPVRPAEIVDARETRRLPLVVGALLAGAAALGLGVAVTLSVRARRFELAVLRAIGATGGEVRRSVYAQVAAVLGAAILVGVPSGIVVGRLGWLTYADQLGIEMAPSWPWAWLAAIIGCAVVLAGAIAAWPAHVATRTSPATALRRLG